MTELLPNRKILFSLEEACENDTRGLQGVDKIHQGISNSAWLILCLCGRVLFDPDQRQNAETASTDRQEIIRDNNGCVVLY